MIICKPKSNIQFVLFALLALVYGLTLFLIGKVMSGVASNFVLVGVVLMLVVSILFTIKVLTGRKTLKIDTGKGKVTVEYLFRSYHFEMSALVSWEEIEIKTFNNQVFRQVDLIFGEQKVSFGEQEHTSYALLIQFLKKHGKKKK